MGLEMFDTSAENILVEEPLWEALKQPLNGTDARRRLEDKLEEKKLLKALREFDFDFDQ